MYYIVNIIHFNHVHERTMALLSVATADPVYFVAGDKSPFLPPTFFLSPFVAFRYITTLSKIERKKEKNARNGCIKQQPQKALLRRRFEVDSANLRNKDKQLS